MKNFTLITLLFILSAFGSSLFAQCTPDPNGRNNPGIYPNDSLPDAEYLLPYDEVIQLVLPKDTTLNVSGFMISASFCGFRLDSLVNLPEGLTYECDVPNCDWSIDHTPGVINRGCVRISGTPTTRIDDDSIRAFIFITPGYIDSARNNYCNSDSFRNDPNISPFWGIIVPFLTQETAIQMRVNGNVSIEEKLIRESVGLTVFPNPLEGNGYVKFELSERTDIVMDVVDQMGRIVQHIENGSANPGENRYEISTTGLASGLYLIRLQLGGGKYVVTEKMTVR